ncbi:hypothetical protein QM012_002167 [Aureobasidium pullulans]|uniref:Uncharacterized protein n=1 Tax=Aureobasidium pullulans TaxID=5580 RepID=A0ABR0TBK7_AURPU
MDAATELDVNSQSNTESDEILDLPPNCEPAHLHSLFENDVVGHTNSSADQTYIQRRSTSMSFKRRQLQVELRRLVPSVHDVRLAVELAPDWLSPAGILFYPLAHQSTADILRTYKRIQIDDVEPAEIGEWVLHFAVVLHRLPHHVDRSRFTSILDVRDHISRSFDTVERLIFNDDDILGTLRGLECGVMMNRFHLMMGQVKKVYINVRREITLALLYCPPDIHNIPHNAASINDSHAQISDEAKSKAFPILLLPHAYALPDRLSLAPPPYTFDDAFKRSGGGCQQPNDFLGRLPQHGQTIQIFEIARVLSTISARIIDFIAFTPVIILLFSLHHGLGGSEDLLTSVDLEADRVLLDEFVHALREVSSLHGSSTAAQVVVAVDTLRNVLENEDATTKDATLRIPLLGLIKIRRKVRSSTQKAMTDGMDSIDSSWTQLLNNSMHETWLQGWDASQNYMSYNFSLELLDPIDMDTFQS